MIRYALRCANGHTFESWFASAAAFEDLRARGLASCGICGSTDVEKTLMAPGVRTTKGKEPEQPPPVSSETQPVSLATPSNPVEAAIAELRAKVEANSDYVGTKFASEARKMHDGDTPLRAIHGEAKPDEAKSLIEDGVPILPLPFGPKQKAN